MEEVLLVSLFAGMGGVLLYLWARARGARLDHEAGIDPKH